MRLANRITWALAGVVLLAAALLLLTACEEKKPVPARETPIPVVAGEGECKAALGFVAMEAVDRLDDEGRLDEATMDERQSVMLDIINENGSFPEECSDYTLSDMNPWMGYASSLAWYCKTIDSHATVDMKEEFLGEPLGAWIVEYQITCPLV